LAIPTKDLILFKSATGDIKKGVINPIEISLSYRGNKFSYYNYVPPSIYFVAKNRVEADFKFSRVFSYPVKWTITNLPKAIAKIKSDLKSIKKLSEA